MVDMYGIVEQMTETIKKCNIFELCELVDYAFANKEKEWVYLLVTNDEVRSFIEDYMLSVLCILEEE
jgi:hypothetical protein